MEACNIWYYIHKNVGPEKWKVWVCLLLASWPWEIPPLHSEPLSHLSEGYPPSLQVYGKNARNIWYHYSTVCSVRHIVNERAPPFRVSGEPLSFLSFQPSSSFEGRWTQVVSCLLGQLCPSASSPRPCQRHNRQDIQGVKPSVTP